VGLDDLVRNYAAPDSILDDDGAVRPEARKQTINEADLERPYVAPGRPALVPMGIMYQGPWKKRSDGISRHVREQAKALAMYLPLNLSEATAVQMFDHEMEPEVFEDVGYLQNVHCSRYVMAIRHFIFGSLDHLRGVIVPGGARFAGDENEDTVYRSTIVYTSWERDRVFQEAVDELNRCAQVWVPCQANADAFVSSGVLHSKVRVVPYPYDPATHGTTKIPLPRGNDMVPPGKRFYAIGKWEPRKDYDRLIGAFFLAFTPRDRVSLTIKTFGWGKWKDYPSMAESGAKWANEPGVIANGWTPKKMDKVLRVIDTNLTDAEMAELHRKNNIYVSSSHGEAFELGAFDALCAGNSLVHVGYGGTAEYAEGHRFLSVHQVPFKMGALPAEYGWEPGAQWSEYELEDLVRMLRAAEPPTERVHPLWFAKKFGRVAVGALMRDLVMSAIRNENPELAEEFEQVGTWG
jgi:glycosyltransferase involved in cell wall biosynthesis